MSYVFPGRVDEKERADDLDSFASVPYIREVVEVQVGGVWCKSPIDKCIGAFRNYMTVHSNSDIVSLNLCEILDREQE